MIEHIEKVKDRLRIALQESGKRQTDIAKETKIPISSISQYLSGYATPKADRIYLMAKALGVSEAWLLGYDVPKEPTYGDACGISGIRRKKIPILNDVVNGKLVYCNEDRESYVDAGTEIDASFCIKFRGDSMTGARINDGDIAFIHAQDTVQNGEIAAIIIDNEVTLKRVYYFPEQHVVILLSDNSSYAPLAYSSKEFDSVNIIGKAIAFQSDVK